MELSLSERARRVKTLFLRIVALAGVVLVIPLVALVVICLSERKHLAEKYRPEAVVTSPKRVAPLEPIQQTEPHTCGFLAISAIFKSYGQDPETARLRYHLGTDRSAVLGRGPEDSTGTLHPDMVRVLNQQDWQVEALALASGAPGERDPVKVGAVELQLERHLQHGPALGLIALGHSKALHWVALDAGDSGRVRVVDSLQPKVRELPIHEFLGERTLSVLLLTPCSSESSKEGSSLAAQHISGTLEMARAATRLQQIEGFTGQ